LIKFDKPQLKHVPYGASMSAMAVVVVVAMAVVVVVAVAAPVKMKCLAARSMHVNATC
jgi:hypothetical protein